MAGEKTRDLSRLLPWCAQSVAGPRQRRGRNAPAFSTGYGAEPGGVALPCLLRLNNGMPAEIDKIPPHDDGFIHRFTTEQQNPAARGQFERNAIAVQPHVGQFVRAEALRIDDNAALQRQDGVLERRIQRQCQGACLRAGDVQSDQGRIEPSGCGVPGMLPGQQGQRASLFGPEGKLGIVVEGRCTVGKPGWQGFHSWAAWMRWVPGSESSVCTMPCPAVIRLT